MTGKHRALRVSCALLAGLALATGCSDTCTCPDDADETGYPDQSTPDNVIEKLEMAYEAMDVGAYMECLAEDFLFVLNPDDVAAAPTLPEYWGKAEERQIHENMFGEDSIIENIALTMTVVSTDSLPGDDPGDPSDDLWEYEVNVVLEVEFGLTYLSTGRSLFVMRRSPDRHEVTWQIIEHYDLGEEPLGTEDTTWTGIKLAFGGPVADSLYPTRSSPGNVLLKLELAYERMDTEAYLDCLAEDLLFFLSLDDITDDPTLPEYWDKAEEAIIHGNMFGEGTDVQSIALIMTTASAEWDGGDPGDPLDDRWTLMEDIDLRVRLHQDLTLHAQSPCEFTLQVDPDETGPSGRLLWEIVRWYDLSEETVRVPDPLVEEASWGGIKAVFR